MNFLRNGFGGDTCADFNVWFFDYHACFEGSTACAAVFCCDDPFTIGVGETGDGDYGDACGVI
jgi:hypothetical protein